MSCEYRSDAGCSSPRRARALASFTDFFPGAIGLTSGESNRARSVLPMCEPAPILKLSAASRSRSIPATFACPGTEAQCSLGSSRCLRRLRLSASSSSDSDSEDWMVRISSRGPLPAFFAAPMREKAFPPPYALAPRNMLISRAPVPTSVIPIVAPSAETTFGRRVGEVRTMSPFGRVNMAYGCLPPSVNAGKKCAIVMASWDQVSRECLRLFCSSKARLSSSSMFLRISSLLPFAGAFGSFLPPPAAALAAASFCCLARTSGSTMGGGVASGG
mmetsp:Transcript_11202/g.45142  ORF Transcript_11202/g.45142 Transcript_11202/m.45142 type:complete len:274 (-) Transcript_11202:3046-3867(-)